MSIKYVKSVKATCDDECYRITPKGIAALALLYSNLVDDICDDRIDEFWAQFEEGMRQNNYVHKN